MMLRELGYKPNIALHCESPDAVEQAVRRNMGVGILYYECVKDAVERGELKVLNTPEFERTGETFIVYHKDRRLSPCARDFLALLRQWKETSRPPKPARTAPAKIPASRAAALV
jgi:DNA-binding transcriptional LysR family regulator